MASPPLPKLGIIRRVKRLDAMPTLFHHPKPPAARKVLIATPTYDDVKGGYASALFETAQHLEYAGIMAECAIRIGDPHVDDNRNAIVRLFLDGDCTDL